MKLTTQCLLELVDLFEGSNQALVGLDDQRVRGVPHWRLTKFASMQGAALSEWMTQTGYAGYFPVPQGDEMFMADLEDDEDNPQNFSYRCPETFRLKTVSRASVAVYAVDAPKFLHQIADLLNIANLHRRGFATPALNNRLWKLGDARIGPALTPVWLVRELTSQVQDVFDHLMSPNFAEQGLVLTTAAALPRVIRPPRNYRIVSLRDALVEYTPAPCIDSNLLERILAAPVDGVMPSLLPVHYDEATQVLFIRTKSTSWTLKGARQAAAVKHMFQQAQISRWTLDASEILAAAYPDRKTPESRKGLRMQDLFKNNPHWKIFLSQPEKGKYSFNLS